MSPGKAFSSIVLISHPFFAQTDKGRNWPFSAQPTVVSMEVDTCLEQRAMMPAPLMLLALL